MKYLQWCVYIITAFLNLLGQYIHIKSSQMRSGMKINIHALLLVLAIKFEDLYGAY